jgi:chemotaxis protein MotB
MSQDENKKSQKDEEEEEPVKCPECKVGAPAWMATFADMATLLMAFFVLILSFAEMNEPKFKQISGSMHNAFGVQRVVPIVEQPMGTTVIDMTFSPSPAPSVTEEMTQETEDREQKDLEIQSKTKESDYDTNEEKEKVQLALAEELARGQVEIVTSGEEIIVQFTAQSAEEKHMPELKKETLDALEKIANVSREIKSELVVHMPSSNGAGNGASQKKDKKAGQDKSDKNTASESQDDITTNDIPPSDSPQETETQAAQEDQQSMRGEQKDELTAKQLTVALKQQIDQGLVNIEKKDGKVIVTIGEGGAFPTGKAELTSQARKLISKISDVAKRDGATIVVKGHTDDVPVIFNERYRDNWDLSTARAVSVIRELSEEKGFSPDQLSAIGYADSRPLVDNKTSGNREKNRRIEIEIEYDK